MMLLCGLCEGGVGGVEWDGKTNVMRGLKQIKEVGVDERG